MEEQIKKRFLLYYRLALVAWILVANVILASMNFSYGWLIFISNIMMFTMEGDIKDRLISVELGGLAGLALTVFALFAISALTPVLGSMAGFILPLAAVLLILIVLHPYAPKVLNNVGFAYLTCATIDTKAFSGHIGTFFISFIVGSVVFNVVCILLMKPMKKLAVRSVERSGARSDSK